VGGVTGAVPEAGGETGVAGDCALAVPAPAMPPSAVQIAIVVPNPAASRSILLLLDPVTRESIKITAQECKRQRARLAARPAAVMTGAPAGAGVNTARIEADVLGLRHR
jgi:hypothetical protein